jgi:hypothetical protein
LQWHLTTGTRCRFDAPASRARDGAKDAFGTVVNKYLSTLVKRRAQTDFVVGKRKPHLARALPELGYDVKRGKTIVGRLTATTFHQRGRQAVSERGMPTLPRAQAPTLRHHKRAEYVHPARASGPGRSAASANSAAPAGKPSLNLAIPLPDVIASPTNC